MLFRHRYDRPMLLQSRSHWLAALLLPGLMLLNACGTGSVPPSPASPSVNVTGNWQIQSAASASGTTTPVAGLLLVGSLTSSGANVIGTFRLANLSMPNSCGTPLAQIVTVSGTMNAAGTLTLTSAPFSGSVLTIQLLVPPILTSFGTGTIAITGGSCMFPSAAAIGAEVANVTGTFSGSVTGNASLPAPPILSGTATLALTQSSTTNSDGQSAVTGTLGFAGGGCTSSVAVAGTVSGSELTLASTPIGLFNYSQDQIVAAVMPTATQLYAAEILYGLGPCNSGTLSIGSYTGNLTRQ